MTLKASFTRNPSNSIHIYFHGSCSSKTLPTDFACKAGGVAACERHNERKKEAQKWIEKLCSEERQRDYQEEKERIEKRYTEAIDAASACYLFGIREFNNTPKLLFNDLRLREECRDLKKCFSIDAKTSIDCSGTEPKSNPRTYKAVRKGMEFDGEIEFYHFDEEICQKCKKYLIQNLEKFNDGIYRLGGSKSRGYGKIHVSILEDGREDSEEL